MSKTYKITGADAIRLAERENLTVHCYANPIDDGGPVTVEVARQIAKDDPSLIYVTVVPAGWRNAQGNHCDDEGRTVDGYFTSSGMYHGPDDDGVEPCWNDAVISDSEVSAYLSGLSSEARADWAAGRLDEVMTDHSTSHFGREINDQIKAVAASLREFAYATDSGSGAVKAASLEDAYQALRSTITDAQVDDGATLWVEDSATGERMTMGKDGAL